MSETLFSRTSVRLGSTGSLHQEIRRLHRERPRRRAARWMGGLLLALVACSWWLGDFRISEMWSPTRQENLERFLTELRPYPLQGRPWDWGIAARWAMDVLTGKGLEAAVRTTAIAVVAIVLSAFGGLALCLTAARTVATPEPFLPSAKTPSGFSRHAWRSVVGLTRAFLIFLRSLPEYIWAFILISLIGPSVWPAILALAIHNGGILGKLNAEVVENLEPSPFCSLRGLGATRGQVVIGGIVPAIVPRFLLFFFYRWESCVREATVLGLLGIVSLGYWIQDARARLHYDEMFFLVLLGAVIVILGDIVSVIAREIIRRAS